MRLRLLWIGLAWAAAAAAFGDDPAARALRERQQQSDSFSLELQQSLQRDRAGPLSPRQRSDLDTLQRDQRLQQDELFYRQGVQQNAPQGAAQRRAETMRQEQERRLQQDYFSRSVEGEVARPQPATPNPQPAPR